MRPHSACIKRGPRKRQGRKENEEPTHGRGPAAACHPFLCRRWGRLGSGFTEASRGSQRPSRSDKNKQSGGNRSRAPRPRSLQHHHQAGPGLRPRPTPSSFPHLRAHRWLIQRGTRGARGSTCASRAAHAHAPLALDGSRSHGRQGPRARGPPRGPPLTSDVAGASGGAKPRRFLTPRCILRPALTDSSIKLVEH